MHRLRLSRKRQAVGFNLARVWASSEEITRCKQVSYWPSWLQNRHKLLMEWVWHCFYFSCITVRFAWKNVQWSMSVNMASWKPFWTLISWCELCVPKIEPCGTSLRTVGGKRGKEKPHSAESVVTFVSCHGCHCFTAERTPEPHPGHSDYSLPRWLVLSGYCACVCVFGVWAAAWWLAQALPCEALLGDVSVLMPHFTQTRKLSHWLRGSWLWVSTEIKCIHKRTLRPDWGKCKKPPKTCQLGRRVSCWHFNWRIVSVADWF